MLIILFYLLMYYDRKNIFWSYLYFVWIGQFIIQHTWSVYKRNQIKI